MRMWSIIFGLIVFVCVVSVSFSHTVDLYERVGFKQWEAVMITIAVETTFLLSGWSILWYRFRGQSPGGPAYAGFVYGIVIVLFSNSAYTVGLGALFANNIAQWVLALSVVFGVLISEAIISRNLIRLSGHNVQPKGVQAEGAQSNVQENGIQMDAQTEGAQAAVVQREQLYVQEGVWTANEHAVQLNAQEASEQNEQEVQNGVQENAEQAKAEQTCAQEQDVQVIAEQQRIVQIEQQRAECVQKRVEQGHVQNNVQKQRTTNNVQEQGEQKSVQEQRTANSVQDDEMYKRVEQEALKLYRETGRFPGRPKLKELTGYTDRQLMPIVRELKKKYKKKCAG